MKAIPTPHWECGEWSIGAIRNNKTISSIQKSDRLLVGTLFLKPNEEFWLKENMGESDENEEDVSEFNNVVAFLTVQELNCTLNCLIMKIQNTTKKSIV